LNLHSLIDGTQLILSEDMPASELKGKSAGKQKAGGGGVLPQKMEESAEEENNKCGVDKEREGDDGSEDDDEDGSECASDDEEEDDQQQSDDSEDEDDSFIKEETIQPETKYWMPPRVSEPVEAWSGLRSPTTPQSVRICAKIWRRETRPRNTSHRLIHRGKACQYSLKGLKS
jgi:hypothetical protein